MVEGSFFNFLVTDKRVAQVGQHRHEHGRDAGQPERD